MSRLLVPKKRGKKGPLLWFLVPIGVYLAVFFLVPLVYDLYISLFDYKLGGQATFVGVKNYVSLLNDSQYLGSLVTTLLFVVAAVALELVLGLAIAMLLNKESKTMDAIRTVILIPTVFTPLVAGLVWKALYHPDLGMITYYLRAVGLNIGRGLTVERSTALLSVMIVDIWEWTPLVVIVLLAMSTYSLAIAVEQALAAGEQTILFLNRRGFSTFLHCRACGHVLRCPDCAVSLTLHRARETLLCHYCGRAERVHEICPVCKAKSLEGMGSGTERVETLVRQRFPQARVARLDRDSAVSGRGQLEAFLDRVHRREIDILVGTQMVTKGHDFGGVTLVGVPARPRHPPAGLSRIRTLVPSHGAGGR